jgi:hypothetical protein
MEELGESDRVMLFGQSLSMKSRLDQEPLSGTLLYLSPENEALILKQENKVTRKVKLRLVNSTVMTDIRVTSKLSPEELREEMRVEKVRVEEALEREFNADL